MNLWFRLNKILRYILICLSLNFLIIYAEWPTTTDEELFVGYGVNPKSVTDGNGGVFIASTYHEFYSSVRIYRIDKDGNISWPDHQILTGSEHQQTLVKTDIISDRNGGMYLVYYDTHFIDYPYFRTSYLRVQHIDSSGSQIWNNNGVTLFAPDDMTQQSSCTGGGTISDGTSGIIVSWLDNRNTSPMSDFGDNYIQRIDFNGNCLWDSGGVRISTSSGCADPPDIVSDGDSGAIIQYFENRTIYFQRVDQNGNKLWGNKGVQGPDSMAVLDIIPNGEDGIFLICRRSYPKWEYWCYQIDSNGVYLWDNDGVYIGEGKLFESGINKPILNPDQSISFTWYFKEKDYFQRITNKGIKIFTGNGISITSLDSVYVYTPVLGINGDNYCFISKQVSRLNYEGRLFIQRIEKDGTRLFGDEGTCISDTRGRDLALGINDIVPDAYDGFILIFMGDPVGIFAKQVSGDGILGLINTGVDTEPVKLLPSEIQLHQNYPNPFNCTTSIRFIIDKYSLIDLSVFSVKGDHVKTLIQGYYPSGTYLINWNGLNDIGKPQPSGIYYYRLISSPESKTNKMLLLK